jgi:dynein heavy chain
VNERLRQAFVQSKLFNSRETLFGNENTDYSSLQALQKEWEPFSLLWVTTHHFLNDSQKWMSGPFDQIDAKHCETSIMNGTKLLFKTVKAFEKRTDCDKVLEIARLIKGQIDEFVPNVPIVMGLRNPGMRERHWKQVGDLVGHEVNPEMADFTLEKFLAMGMVSKANIVADIGDRSGK